MKHFLWQAISSCVATAERLTFRHMGTDRSCPRCAAPVESINHLLFECPPALQVWALSDYPSLPGYFPSTSIYQNMNFLFWKRKEVAPRRPHFDTFPWICWFIWKARNDKLFNGKVVSSMDTLQHATLEAEFWRKANEKEEEIEDQRGSINLEEGTETLGIPRNPTCQIDASWINDGSVSGLGWSLKDYMDSENFGMRACHQCLSALHAEMEGLIWATACIKNMRITSPALTLWSNPNIRCNGKLPPGCKGQIQVLFYQRENVVYMIISTYGSLFQTNIMDSDVIFEIFRQENQSFEHSYPDLFVKVLGKDNLFFKTGDIHKHIKKTTMHNEKF
ncbi:hypothetical protein N665_0428s0016 [Sinapis alba]|nr:hypothetical protein N665_0428s0016 [Sinapis alba]